MGCQQFLPLSVVQLKGKHCRKPHCHNGFVDTFGHRLPYNPKVASLTVHSVFVLLFYCKHHNQEVFCICITLKCVRLGDYSTGMGQYVDNNVCLKAFKIVSR